MTPTSNTAALLAVALLALSGCGEAKDATRADEAAIATLSSPAAPGSGEPNLAVGADGAVWLSWIEPAPDSAHALRVARLDGERWTTPGTVVTRNDLFVNWADFPSVLPRGGERLAAHWLQRSGPGKYSYDVRLATSEDGGRTWSAGVIPHQDGTESEHGFASLWADGDSVRAVWLDGRGYATGRKEMRLVTAALARDGRTGGERTLDTRICDCCQTSLARTREGVVVAFRDRSPEEIRDISTVRWANGAWTEPTRVHADEWKIDACPVNGPALSARGDTVAIAWFTGARDTARVNVAFSPDGGATWGPPLRVDDGRPAGRVDVELLDDGLVVSWLERLGGDTAAVRARRVVRDAAGAMTAGTPITVASSSGQRASGFPRMARAGAGVLFAWTVPGDSGGVRVARLDPSRLPR